MPAQGQVWFNRLTGSSLAYIHMEMNVNAKHARLCVDVAVVTVVQNMDIY